MVMWRRLNISRKMAACSLFFSQVFFLFRGECSYEVNAHVPKLSPWPLIASSMQIKDKWPWKSSQVNDSSGRQKTARHMEGGAWWRISRPFFLASIQGLDTRASQGSVNTALLYTQNFVIVMHDPKYVNTICPPDVTTYIWHVLHSA